MQAPGVILSGAATTKLTKVTGQHGERLILLALLAILVCSAFFRFYGRDFDQKTSQHPDERAIIDRSLSIVWPASAEQFLDVRNSTLNLRAVRGDCPPDGCRYPYGSLPVYITRAAGWVVDIFLPEGGTTPKGYFLSDWSGVQLIGRHLASLFDLITIVLVFLIGRRLFSSIAGLIAAALVGFSVTNIQIAHFYTSDTFLVTFMMGALYFSVKLMQRPSAWSAAAAGICLGLAVASKVSVAPFALVVLAAVALRAVYRRRTRDLGAEFGDPVGLKAAHARERARSGAGHFTRGLAYVALAAFFALLAFAVTEPYALVSFDFSRWESGGAQAVLDSNPWWGGIAEEANKQSGIVDVPFTRQYVGTIPVLYHLQNLVLWGLSPIPGLVVLIGAAAGLWRAFRGKAAELLLMAGALPYAVPVLLVEAKWMRYVLPLVPIFCLLGAAWLVRGAIGARERYANTAHERHERHPRISIRSLHRRLYPILGVLAVGGAFLWSVAFMNIYTQPHSRVQASRWIYDNVPSGISRSSEGWDDSLPLGVALEPDSVRPTYNLESPVGDPIQFDIYGDRPPDVAFSYLADRMRQADWIFIASNRLYGSITRLPWRYPVQIEFYRLLYSGKLGYKLRHTSHVTPEIFGLRIDDQSADESFTVYDHPRVDLFEKVTEIPEAELRILFSSALNRPGGEYSQARYGKVSDDKSLVYNETLAQQPVVDDYAWNPLGGEETQWIAVGLWLLVAYALGILVLPILFTITRNLPDAGYPFAKVAGLLLLSWVMWMLASTRRLPFTVTGLLVVVVLLGGLSYLCWRLGAGTELRAFWRSKRKLVFFYEAVFLAAFALFLFIRMLNPDLWHPSLGGEKPMEFGYLNAVLRSPWMPPLDPFYAEGYINYYYHGLFIVASLIKLTGIHPAIAFNLAIPLIFGLTFTAITSIVYNLVAWSRRDRDSLRQVSLMGMAFGVLGGVLALLIGNLHGLMQIFFIANPELGANVAAWAVNVGFTEQSIVRPSFTSFDFWGSSRLIPGTINEFPFWSFLFADLHPHLINMPFTLFVAALSLNIAFAPAFQHAVRPQTSPMRSVHSTLFLDTLNWLWGGKWRGVLRFSVFALALGALAVINSWDFPTYALLATGGMAIALLRRLSLGPEVEGGSERAVTVRSWTWAERLTLGGAAVASSIGLAGAAILAYLPFFLSFKALYTQIFPLVDGGLIPNTATVMRRTTLPEFLLIWGLFVFLALSYLMLRLRKFPWRDATSDLGGRLGFSNSETDAPNVARLAATRSFAPFRSNRMRLAAATTASTIGRPGDVEAVSARLEERQPAPDVILNVGEADAPVGGEVSRGDSTLALITSSSTGASNTLKEEWPVDENLDDALADLDIEPLAAQDNQSNWLAWADTADTPSPLARRPVVSHGVVPLWLGLVGLGITLTLVTLQLVTGQYLLALLVALIGGIAFTTLSSTRSPSALFCALLLVAGIGVAMGVELVYLADHLKDGSLFRMNTVFKFYIQVWLLLAAGGAMVIYYVLIGITERGMQAPSQVSLSVEDAGRQRTVPGESEETTLQGQHGDIITGTEAGGAADNRETDRIQWASNNGSSANWLVWPSDTQQEGTGTSLVTSDSGAEPEEVSRGEWRASESRNHDGPRLTVAQVVWLGFFLLLLFASLIFTFLGTQDRVGERFNSHPPIGTLNGLKYMTVSEAIVTNVYKDANVAPFPLIFKYDYDAINWMNRNLKSGIVIAEAPVEYYRANGMRAASNTGLPMVVGGLHQEEQRYGWLVGQRRGEMDDFFATGDVQRALTIINKYGIDYIYFGQLERARAGEEGAAKFRQMASPGVGLLRQVFPAEDSGGGSGTTIYQVIGDIEAVAGAPVSGSGVPGISITPIPTRTPVPPPTPPVDDPTLRAIQEQVNANPLDRELRLQLVEWYKANGFFQDAARELEAIVALEPGNIAVRHSLGDVYQAAGAAEKALATWEAARDIEPNNPAGHNKVGVAYLERGRYDDAVREFQAAVQSDPRFVESWFHLGTTLEGKGQLDAARNAYENAIKNSPEDNTWKRSAQEALAKLK